MPEFYMILARRIIKIGLPQFLWHLPEKCTKFPNLHDFCPKNAWILHNKCPKNIFSRTLGGTCPRPAPVSYAYADLDPPGPSNPHTHGPYGRRHRINWATVCPPLIRGAGSLRTGVQENSIYPTFHNAQFWKKKMVANCNDCKKMHGPAHAESPNPIVSS